jgi:hypothetical protein
VYLAELLIITQYTKTPPIILIIEPNIESLIPTRDTIENTSTIIPQMLLLLLSSIAPMITTIPEMSTIDEKNGKNGSIPINSRPNCPIIPLFI